ncbi:hypothetical protein XELAEV_18015296mg [Xenopus laevis]|uniref:Uncharacterized protein n=1 Tax=Xenopus laevis TaxID=8355 RepID=A0A974DK60_XENLA|nr:hypothetical protein XELAEV_18015296mg [Xenopus laevis]
MNLVKYEGSLEFGIVSSNFPRYKCHIRHDKKNKMGCHQCHIPCHSLSDSQQCIDYEYTQQKTRHTKPQLDVQISVLCLFVRLTWT